MANYWEDLRLAANNIRTALNSKPIEERIQCRKDNVGSILNGYREGDMDFNDAVYWINELIQGAAQDSGAISAQQPQPKSEN